MNFDNSWDAVLEPGKATLYFDVLSDIGFEVDSLSYSKINAWWLAELCRLVYRQGADEDDDGVQDDGRHHPCLGQGVAARQREWDPGKTDERAAPDLESEVESVARLDRVLALA